MTRCQHCNKLTHSEDLYVEYKSEDYDKINELQRLIGWKSTFEYPLEETTSNEIGKLKCGDIYIHFCKVEEKKT